MMTLIKRSVVPLGNKGYGIPAKDRGTIKLAISDGKHQEAIEVFIQAIVPDWSPSGIRLEGYTAYRGRPYRVIAYYDINSTEAVLGKIHMSSI